MFIRYDDVNEMNFAPLQLEIKHFWGEIHKLKNYITLMSIQSNNKFLLENVEKYGIRLLN